MASAKRWMLLGAVATALGLAIAGTAPALGTAPADRVQAQQRVGGVTVAIGWILLALGLHRFGRRS